MGFTKHKQVLNIHEDLIQSLIDDTYVVSGDVNIEHL